MKNHLLIFLYLLLSGCNSSEKKWIPYDESSEITNNKTHSLERMQFKLIQSKFNDKNIWFSELDNYLRDFSEDDYEKLKPLIIEKDIPSIQTNIIHKKLTYEKLVLFYLFRIKKIEFNKNTYLNSIISLNPNIVLEARKKDKIKPESIYSLHGIPILLKDNINFDGLPTTAGAEILKNNIADDSFVVKKLKESGAVILGKTNLSEWAYYFCVGCPLGYSAIGGQTLNPYGRKEFESGGSSSGSGAAISANFSSVSLGSETSGSILSPSSLNSIVGLKPTIGLVSRTGIIPISNTLDTSGPMTKNVIDNAIVFNSIMGFDQDDSHSKNKININYNEIINSSLKDKRLGVFKSLLNDSLYLKTIEDIKRAGGIIIEFEPPKINFLGFRKILDVEMKNELPKYLSTYFKDNLNIKNISDIINYNLQDSLNRSPYGQQIFEGIVSDNTGKGEFEKLKVRLKKEGGRYFNESLKKYSLDAILSINNYHAAYAAAASYPCLTVPMGYNKSGLPSNLTFISSSFKENKLYQLGYAYEKLSNKRVAPF
ncbi:amidase family protein [Flavobacteriaceae bacterium]|jgi:amidase|nr:amidase family protein [Flavobacteriaceae bacterium]